MFRLRITLSVALLSASFLSAQTSDSLQSRELEQVSVSALRANKDVIITQTTVEKAEIEKVYQGQDGAFLLESLSPSIVSYSESGTNFGNYGQMRLRGIDQTRINITLNGVPLNDMIDQGVFFSNFTDFGNSIQSVQVQRGVGLTSNGVASYAGSVNFESLSLSGNNPWAEVQLSGGSFGTLRGSAELFTGRTEEGTAFYARYTHTQSDGYRDHTGTLSNSIFFSGAMFRERHVLKFTGFAGKSQNGLAYTPVALSDIQNDPKTNYINVNDVDDFGQYLMQLQHTYRLSASNFLVSTLYYGGAGGDFPFGYFDDSSQFTQINYPLYNHHYGVISYFNHRFNEASGQLNIGVHAYGFNRQNVEYIIPNRDAPYYDDNSSKNEFSAFGNWQKTMRSWSVFADLQFRAVSLTLEPDPVFLGMPAVVPTRSYVFLNPKAGINYRFSDKVTTYLSFGRSGREPTRFDILGSTQINSANLGIAQDENSIDPEFVNDFEVGVIYISDKLTVEANGFLMLFENEIAPIGEFIPEGFVQVRKNQESSYRAGIEWTVNWLAVQRLTIFSQGALMKSKISSFTPEGGTMTFMDVVPILSPEINTTIGARFYLLKNLAVQADMRYLSSSFMELTNDPTFVVPASTVVNAGINWQIYKEHSLLLEIKNLGNVLYYTYGAPSFDFTEPAYFVQAPLSLYATLRLRF